MLGSKLWKKWKNTQDEKLLAQHKALDAELGLPTRETLNERARGAAEKGLWKTAFYALDNGADVNMPLNTKQTYSGVHGGFTFGKNYSLAFLAIEQNNAGVLGALLGRGADRDFTGSSRVNEREHKYSLPEYAANQGAAESLGVLLAGGVKQQAALNGALAIAAGEKSYNGMVAALLENGAQGYNAALRAAELRNNKQAIRMIRAAQAKNPEAATQEGKDMRFDTLSLILGSAPAEDRQRLLAGLQEKFAAAAPVDAAEKPFLPPAAQNGVPRSPNSPNTL